jgi:hypothetical protein
MKVPPTAQGYDGPPNPGDGNPEEIALGLRLTTRGTIQIVFPCPINFIELNFYQAQELAKGLRKGCKKLLRDGFAVQSREPSDNFPWGRFGLAPDVPGVPDTGEPPPDSE